MAKYVVSEKIDNLSKEFDALAKELEILKLQVDQTEGRLLKVQRRLNDAVSEHIRKKVAERI